MEYVLSYTYYFSYEAETLEIAAPDMFITADNLILKMVYYFQRVLFSFVEGMIGLFNYLWEETRS